MAIGKMLNSELSQWGILAIVLVLFMVILNQFKTVVSRTSGLGNGTTGTLNASIQGYVDDYTTGLSEPKNWVSIFVIAVIGFGVIKYVRSKD